MSNKLMPYSAHNPEEYLLSRVEQLTGAYRTKANVYRWCYLTLATTSAIAAATVPLLICLKEVPTIYPIMLSLIVNVLIAIEGIFHWREQWKSYDRMKSFLHQESCLFQSGSGAYRAKSLPDAFMLFVERVEEEIAKDPIDYMDLHSSYGLNRSDKSNDPSGVSQLKSCTLSNSSLK